MVRVMGAIKVLAVLLIDFITVYSIFGNYVIAAVVTSIISFYVCIGGYISLLKERAVHIDKISVYEKDRLINAKLQLVEDLKKYNGINISKLKIYLISEDEGMQATAYGCGCVSVSNGTLRNVDPVTLRSVLAHEVSHIINFDPEFNRAIFCSITLVVATLGIMSTATIVIVFFIFLLLNCFRSWIGVMAFSGMTKLISGSFKFIQKSIVVMYNSVLNLIKRHSEYRSDMFSCYLGYGVQLSNFLRIAAPDEHQAFTISEALYRTHPPTIKRIARIEEYCNRRNEIQFK